MNKKLKIFIYKSPGLESNLTKWDNMKFPSLIAFEWVCEGVGGVWGGCEVSHIAASETPSKVR